mmetsp:Transcript_59066/g.125497  ORF Transcript_59066/g.125497 Transcript_59066/m.125497 type:complete len:108 (+) Transcript_59066:235-558(+)
MNLLGPLLLPPGVRLRHGPGRDSAARRAFRRRYEFHLLSFLRIRCFVRVVQTAVANEASRHDRTREELETEREKRLSKQSRDAAKGCREEIATSREAPKAAQDVAAV